MLFRSPGWCLERLLPWLHDDVLTGKLGCLLTRKFLLRKNQPAVSHAAVPWLVLKVSRQYLLWGHTDHLNAGEMLGWRATCTRDCLCRGRLPIGWVFKMLLNTLP